MDSESTPAIKPAPRKLTFLGDMVGDVLAPGAAQSPSFGLADLDAATGGLQPACCQRSRRRQQVCPEPNPRSRGRSCQAMSLWSTYRMPCRHSRSSTGRDPGAFSGQGGSSRSISAHKSSSTIHGRVLTPSRTAGSSHRSRPTRTLQQDRVTSSEAQGRAAYRRRCPRCLVSLGCSRPTATTRRWCPSAILTRRPARRCLAARLIAPPGEGDVVARCPRYVPSHVSKRSPQRGARKRSARRPERPSRARVCGPLDRMYERQ